MPFALIQSGQALCILETHKTLANSEDPDKMQHNAAFHQGLHCLVRSNHLEGQRNVIIKQDQTLLWTCVAGAHLQCVNNHYGKFEDNFNYRLHTNKQCKHSKGGVDVIMSKFNNPKNIIKCAHNIVCTYVQCVSNHNV